MSTEAPRTELPAPPDPAQDRSPAAASAPQSIAAFLTVLRWIIGYGQELAAALRHGSIGSDLARVAQRYRSSDLKLILARLQRGLMLAAGLEDRLLGWAATGRDLKPAPYRHSQTRSRRPGDPQRHRAPRRTNIVDLPLDQLPSAEQIADELRRRPAGAVLADICRDLGILPSDLPRDLQDALQTMVLRYGGSMLVVIWKEATDDLRRRLAAEMQRAKDARAAARAARAATAPQPTPACPTGPPLASAA